MKYYLSVDGGGTKTAFLLCGENGMVQADCILGPANYMVNGTESVLSVLKEGVLKICCQAKIAQSDILGAFIAIAGYGDVPEDVPVITRLVEEAFPRIPLTLGNDTENALAGSLPGRRGVHIIAGTGSIGLGIDRAGRYVRCGGWHHLFGGDEGSAYWIGCQLLIHFTKQADGREEKSELYDYIMRKYDLSCPEDILKLVVTEWEGKRDKIAGFSRDASELAEKGDKNARRIFFDAAGELALIVKGIVSHGNFDFPVSVSYSGGVFKSMKYLKDAFEESLKDIPHHLCGPQLPPAAGGILLACERSGGSISQEMLKNLSTVWDIF